jgi:electron transfer flavoprotein beta subunit
MTVRRDPRAERQARLIADGERRRFGLTAAHMPSSRPRRDPRALRRAATATAGVRPRIDWQAGRTGAAMGFGGVEIAKPAASQPEIRIIDDPAFIVLAIPDHPSGALSDHDRELIGAGRQFADASGGAVAVLTSAEIDGLDKAGADRSIVLPAHRSKRRLEPEFGKIDADEQQVAPMHEPWACVSALEHDPQSMSPRRQGWMPVLRKDHAPNKRIESRSDAIRTDKALAEESGRHDPEGYAAAVLAAMTLLKPRHVLFTESPDGGADLARRVAALSGERLFSGVESIASGRVSRRTCGGDMEMISAPPLLMSIAEGASAPHEGVRHEARRLEPPEFSATRKIVRAAPLKVEADAIALSDADFVLSGGNGVTDWPAFAELAQVLGATPGGSRVACDEGHLPRDRQVGASGSVVSARCYLAFGIAGAPQHLQGIAEVRHVVAVNTDLHAEMIKRADLAIIADAQEVMPALIRHVSTAPVAAGRPPTSTMDLPSHNEELSERVDVAASGPLSHREPLRRTTSVRHRERDRVRRYESSIDHNPSPPPSPYGRGGVLRLMQFLRLDRKDQEDGFAEISVVSEATAGFFAGRRAKVAVLLSVGQHPASGRARRAPLDARALEMALSLPGAEVCAVHAGDPAEPALRDYLGMGLERLTVLAIPLGSDPVAALSAHLAQVTPDIILCGNRAEGGEDSGMLPYLIAQALSCAMVADVAAITIDGGKASLTQALPRGKRRLVEVRLPVVAAVSAAAPAPRQSAFARARRGIVEMVAAEASANNLLSECETRPWRSRPKPMRVVAGSAADRLKAMTETKSGEGKVMIHPPAEEAARAIYDYLLEKRIIGDVR